MPGGLNRYATEISASINRFLTCRTAAVLAADAEFWRTLRPRSSAGVSALARTLSLRTASAHFIRVLPASTCPVEPSMVRVSPFFNVMPPALIVCAR